MQLYTPSYGSILMGWYEIKSYQLTVIQYYEKEVSGC